MGKPSKSIEVHHDVHVYFPPTNMTMFIGEPFLSFILHSFPPKKINILWHPQLIWYVHGYVPEYGHFSSTNPYAPIYATHGAGICTPTFAQNPKITQLLVVFYIPAPWVAGRWDLFHQRVNPRPAQPSGHHGLQLSLMAPCLDPERSFGDVFPCLRRSETLGRVQKMVKMRQNGRSTWRLPWPLWPWDFMAKFSEFQWISPKLQKVFSIDLWYRWWLVMVKDDWG